jgi:general nucleoside transport system ATP-binding protein
LSLVFLVMLTLSQISKRFGALLALADVSFDVAAGEVHALLGENGAGKSTLMKIAAGLLAPDAGTVTRPAAVGLAHQHFTSIPEFTVAENLALQGRWPETGRAAGRRAAELIARLGMPLDPHAATATLSVQLRQRLEIVQALAGDAKVLLLDEPSAALAPREVAELLTQVRAFAAAGGAVVLITHKLREVLGVADRVTVLRRGRVVLSGSVLGQTEGTLAEAMLGEQVQSSRAQREISAPSTSPTRVELGPAILALRAGELVGLCAIEGNGQRPLLRAIAGLAQHPYVVVHGTAALLPEDRLREAMIPAMSLTENLALAGLGTRRGWMPWGALATRARELMTRHDVRADGPDRIAATLSGGNQQKFVIARTLDSQPDVLVAEDPTRGLDILATAAVHEALRSAVRDGACVVVHASDLDEVLGLADRILVMCDNVLTELPADATREQVGDAMLGRRA